MKIKTITCHDVYNVGASLQAYALLTYLTKLGHDVEVIDYKPDYLVHYRLTGLNNNRYDFPIVRILYQIAKLPKRIYDRLGKRKREFDYFTNNYLITTSRTYTSNDDLKKNLPYADIYFAGSDQIWNTIFQNGKDPAFYLDFVENNCIKASYAASFATETIDEKYKTNVKKWVNNLNFISVREKSGLKILKDLGIVRAIQVLDPVFLLCKNEWINIEKDLSIDDNYILIYDFDLNPTILSYAKKIAREKKWKIYSVLKNKNCDRSFYNEGPAAFIYLIRNAKFIISNSFHATAFSIIFRKNFLVFNRKESINTRMKDLLETFDLEDRIVTGDNMPNINVNYKILDDNIDKEIKKSKEYIQNVLKGENYD